MVWSVPIGVGIAIASIAIAFAIRGRKVAVFAEAVSEGGSVASAPLGQKHQWELDGREIVSLTFRLFRQNFSKYVAVFLIVYAVVGLLSTLVKVAVPIPPFPSPSTLTPEQTLSQMWAFLGPTYLNIFLDAVISLVVGSIATGAAIKLTSEEWEKGQASAVASLRFAVSRLPSIWGVTILYGIIVGLGSAALFVPGIILGIMFCLALPSVLIQRVGVLDSLDRSRQLVSHRWLKTLAIFLLFGVIVYGLNLVVGLVTAPLGIGSTLVSTLVSALYFPLLGEFREIETAGP